MIKLKNIKIGKAIFVALLSMVAINCNNIFSVQTDIMITKLYEMKKNFASEDAEFIQSCLEKYRVAFDEKTREVRLRRQSHFFDDGVILDCFKHALLINILNSEHKKQQHMASIDCLEEVIDIISDRTFEEDIYDSALSPEFYRFQILKVF